MTRGATRRRHHHVIFLPDVHLANGPTHGTDELFELESGGKNFLSPEKKTNEKGLQ
jgi:hypothetical protein